jgi:hypothetical protein
VRYVENYYATLQVDPAAEPEVIESAYRRLALKYHPDVNKSPEAALQMRALNLAYATLNNPSRRAIYDRHLRQSGIRSRLERPASGRDVIRNLNDARPNALSYQLYEAGLAPIRARASAALQEWSSAWAVCLDQLLYGDRHARQRAIDAGQVCLDELSECLARWEKLVPPSRASRLGDLGASCLKLELALVRGSLGFAETTDFSMLQPLAGLAERIRDLTRTIEAESIVVARAA